MAIITTTHAKGDFSNAQFGFPEQSFGFKYFQIREVGSRCLIEHKRPVPEHIPITEAIFFSQLRKVDFFRKVGLQIRGNFPNFLFIIVLRDIVFDSLQKTFVNQDVTIQVKTVGYAKLSKPAA